MNEQALLQRIAGRDLEAFAELFEVAAPAVFVSALRLSRSQGAAKDITGIVFLDLWSRPEHYRDESRSLRLRLATVAHHTGIEWLRQDNGHATGISEVVAAVDELQVLEKVRLALDALPSQQSVPIRMASFDGQNYRQIAGALRLPEATVKARIRTGLRRLSAAIRSDGSRQILERSSK